MELLSSWKSWKNQKESIAYVILEQIFVLSSSSSSLTNFLFAETPCQGIANALSPAPIKSKNIALLLPSETAGELSCILDFFSCWFNFVLPFKISLFP